jgi:hypothetical protein
MKKMRLIVSFIVLLVSLIWAGKLLYSMSHLNYIGGDFIAYWAYGQLLLKGENPYSPEKILVLQQAVGWTYQEPTVLYNPPWILPFVFPFCTNDYFISKTLWMIIMLALVFYNANLLWTVYGGKEDTRWLSLFLILTFSPVIFMMIRGQIVPLVLLGVVGFLYFVDKKKDSVAAIFVILMAIKPHILYLFWIAFLLWVLHQKKWALLKILILIGTIILLFPLIFNPQVYSQYFYQMLNQEAAFKWKTPTVSALVTLWMRPNFRWIPTIPILMSILWLIPYWYKRRNRWDWNLQVPVLLLISMITISYIWTSDFALLIIIIIQSTIWILNENKFCKILSMGIYFLINLAAYSVYLIFQLRGEHNLVWFVPVISIAYLVLYRSKNLKLPSLVR